MMHLGTWRPSAEAFITGYDHVSIFVLVAGSYTATGLLTLTGSGRIAMVAMAWTGAADGTVLRRIHLGEPRWVRTGI